MITSNLAFYSVSNAMMLQCEPSEPEAVSTANAKDVPVFMHADEKYIGRKRLKPSLALKFDL